MLAGWVGALIFAFWGDFRLDQINSVGLVEQRYECVFRRKINITKRSTFRLKQNVSRFQKKKDKVQLKERKHESGLQYSFMWVVNLRIITGHALLKQKIRTAKGKNRLNGQRAVVAHTFDHSYPG